MKSKWFKFWYRTFKNWSNFHYRMFHAFSWLSYNAYDKVKQDLRRHERVRDGLLTIFARWVRKLVRRR